MMGKAMLRLLDQIVYFIACIAAGFLAFFFGGLFFDGTENQAIWISALAALYFLNAFLLGWLWWRFSPLSSRRLRKQDD
ncbi:hypothetical protein [Tateyamaria sp. syn59]|uniref:hypothetical protein n=1 Tax=Tateyamaria sp. syn59 TaxID=2576942 RepID=UPI0011BE79D7|nr:hypothetical protein [Tateyamaria sp. syn59]